MTSYWIFNMSIYLYQYCIHMLILLTRSIVQKDLLTGHGTGRKKERQTEEEMRRVSDWTGLRLGEAL